jgi:hypothetical protein
MAVVQQWDINGLNSGPKVRSHGFVAFNGYWLQVRLTPNVKVRYPFPFCGLRMVAAASIERVYLNERGGHLVRPQV